MRAAVTLHIDAPPDRVWGLISDITEMGEYSPEVVEDATSGWMATSWGMVMGRAASESSSTSRRRPAVYRWSAPTIRSRTCSWSASESWCGRPTSPSHGV